MTLEVKNCDIIYFFLIILTFNVRIATCHDHNIWSHDLTLHFILTYMTYKVIITVCLTKLFFPYVAKMDFHEMK